MANHYLSSPADIGLKPHQYQLIEDIVLSHPQIQHAWVFGSRALGTFKDSSDIDLVVEGVDLSLSVISNFQDQFDQSTLPYRVDLLIKHQITSKELIEHIEKHGVRLK